MEDHSSGMEQVSILLCSELTITKINKTLRDHVSFVGNLYANGSWRLHRTTQLNITAALVLEDDQSLAILSRIRSETGPRKTIKKSPPTPVWSVKSPEMTAGFPVAQLNYERV